MNIGEFKYPKYTSLEYRKIYDEVNSLFDDNKEYTKGELIYRLRNYKRIHLKIGLVFIISFLSFLFLIPYFIVDFFCIEELNYKYTIWFFSTTIGVFLLNSNDISKHVDLNIKIKALMWILAANANIQNHDLVSKNVFVQN